MEDYQQGTGSVVLHPILVYHTRLIHEHRFTAFCQAMPISKSLLKKLLPVISTALFYALYYLISSLQFNVQIRPAAVPFDYLLLLIISYMLFALSRRARVFVVLQGLLMGVLYVGNAVKISYFGGPIMPDDAFALHALLLVLEGWHFIAAALPLAAIAALLLFNFTLRHWSAYLASMLLLLLGMTLVLKPAVILQPLDRYFGNSVWDQRSNYINRGAMLNLLQEGARFFASAHAVPDRDIALTAGASLLKNATQDTGEPGNLTPRNVHIVLLESFWDPALLKQAGYNQDPLAPAFRQLWKQAGYSHAMSPVFGGYTANAEFEILCGFPVMEDSVKFERQLRNDVPCLPRLLAEHGYHTLASHPNIPVFWNRVNAYRRIGFQTYWSKDDFLLDDMNREFLSDASLYRQVLDKMEGYLDRKQPLLDYIVTYFGHWNYPLSESRPNRITSSSKVKEVSTYANTVYYKSLELMTFLEHLKARDPDSIIVLFGDHLPFMGENFAGYADSVVLTSKRSDFSIDMFRFYVSTPMIIIDGPRGAVKTGDLAIYEIPALLLKLLHLNEPTIMDYTHTPDGMQIRPLPGLHLDLLADGTIEVCKEPPFSPTCQASTNWLQDIQIVNDDLFIGQQFTRQPYRGGKNASVDVPPAQP
jgi:phosphoglycerol transferase MdoB-like AlkP superfamily enzyme